MVLAIPIFITFMATGLVPRIPTAILSTGLMILAFLSIAIGFVLDTVTRGRREMKLLAYLAQPPFKEVMYLFSWSLATSIFHFQWSPVASAAAGRCVRSGVSTQSRPPATPSTR